ncbi:hypothetical protein ACQEU2_32330 [Microtetraspora malaysiensis]
MILGVLALVLVVGGGAGVGFILRDKGDAQAQEQGKSATDPSTTVATDEEITALVDQHSKALTAGDAAAFTSIFDKKNAALVRDQTRVLANLRKMPFSEMSYKVLERDGRAEDSFGRGVKFTQDVAFVHRFAGIDLRPVSEWYRWTIEKASADAPLVVTKVTGASIPASGAGRSKTVYYPGPWDIWPDVTVVKAGGNVVLAQPQDAALAQRVASTVAGAATANLAYWKRNGDPDAQVPAGFVVALVKGKAQLGNLFRKAKANEAGVSIGMPAWRSLGDTVKIGGTRVVMDTTSSFFDEAEGISEISKHELAHSLVAGLDSAEFSLFGKANWIIEGFAEYVANRDQPIERNLRFGEGRAYLAGQLAQPFDGRLPDNPTWDTKDMTSIHYLMGHLAMRYIAERYGDQKLVAGVVAAYRSHGDDSEAALFQELGASKTDFERQWAAYVRRVLA